MAALSYSFQILAQAGDLIDGETVSGTIGSVALNNNADVAFSTSNTTVQQIFTGSTHLTSLGQTLLGDTVQTLSRELDINDQGQVTFSADVGPGFIGRETRLFLHGPSSGTASLAAPGDVIDGRTISAIDGEAAINDNGDTAFVASWNNGGADTGSGLFSGSALLLAENPTAGPGQLRNMAHELPGLNGDGTAVVFGTDGSAPSGKVAVFLSSGGFAAIAGNTIGGATWIGNSIWGTDPRINDSGEVAFRGSTANPSGGGIVQAIWTTDDRLVARQNDKIDGVLIGDLSGAYAINASGQVAFNTRVDGNNSVRGIFVDDVYVARKDIYIEGELSGTPTGALALNDRGQILYSAALNASGSTAPSANRSSLILATPIVDDFAALFTAGSPAILEQAFDSALTSGLSYFSYDYRFLDTAGSLSVYLDGTLLDQIFAPASLASDLLTRVRSVDFGSFGGTSHLWRFVYDGPTGTRMLLDNIQAPGIGNGDFQGSTLDPWTLAADNAGDVTIALSNDVASPSPVALLLPALAAIFARRRPSRA